MIPPAGKFPVKWAVVSHARRLPLLLSGVFLNGCGAKRMQSALDPAGPASERINWLTWLLFGIAGGVFLITMGLMLLALIRRARPDAPTEQTSGAKGTPFVIIAGIVIPAVILVGVFLASLQTTVALRTPAAPLTVKVIGHQWWWEVRYPQQNIVTANEIYIPAGQPVRIDLDSADVNHSFWVPNLNGKMDLIPGHPNTFWIHAAKAGRYRGQCAEYCGLQHAHMSFWVIAQPPNEFQNWTAANQKSQVTPSEGDLARGKQVFFLAGCKGCHAVGGTTAKGNVGPDLTHIASRQTLGAGTLQNTPGNLEGWLIDPQSAKPGNKMPRIYLPPADLHALRAWLERLN